MAEKQPFKLISAEEEAERASGTRYQDEFRLYTPWQREVVGALQGLQAGQEKLFQGQTDLTVAFGELVPRVRKLEATAQWKVWVVRGLKAAIPVAAALLGRYAPELAKHLPDLVELLTSVPL